MMTCTIVFINLLLISLNSIDSLQITHIVNATYSTCSSFLKLNVTKSSACMCTCFAHPHCLSISITQILGTTYFCQLFATYPTNIFQLSSSSTSNVTIHTNRALSSVYIDNGTQLFNPQNLSFNVDNPWIPIFKLYTGNNQSFLWINSSNLTTLIDIPTISIYEPKSHWFNILVSQWNEMSYVPKQIAIAFIVNRTNIVDFLTFNATQTNITNWFSLKSLLSNQFWSIKQYQTPLISQTQMKSIYIDSDCIRSFNCNFKYSTSGCNLDFYGFFFVYDGYKDLCVASALAGIQIPIPTIYFSPTSNHTNGNLSYFRIADGLMGFVR